MSPRPEREEANRPERPKTTDESAEDRAPPLPPRSAAVHPKTTTEESAEDRLSSVTSLLDPRFKSLSDNDSAGWKDHTEMRNLQKKLGANGGDNAPYFTVSPSSSCKSFQMQESAVAAEDALSPYSRRRNSGTTESLVSAMGNLSVSKYPKYCCEQRT